MTGQGGYFNSVGNGVHTLGSPLRILQNVDYDAAEPARLPNRGPSAIPKTTLQLTEGVRHSGWLLKASGKGPNRKWRKKWVRSCASA